MDCKETHLPIEYFIDAISRTGSGLTGIAIVEVTGHNESAINCGNQHITAEELFKNSIGVDVCGNPALRVKIIQTCNKDELCGVVKNIRECFAYDSVEKTFAFVLNKSI